MIKTSSSARFPSNTLIGVVATNARLTKEQANKVAQMAQAGVARAVRPAHTMYDGDTLCAIHRAGVRRREPGRGVCGRGDGRGGGAGG